jgi:hypothetical protein
MMPEAEWHALYLPELYNVRVALDWAFGSGGDVVNPALQQREISP